MLPPLDRVRDRPIVLRGLGADDLSRVIERDAWATHGIEQQPFDVTAQTRDVGAGALRHETSRSRVDLLPRPADGLLDQRLRLSRGLTQVEASVAARPSIPNTRRCVACFCSVL